MQIAADVTISQLTDFIVRAKAAAYVGSGQHSLSYRPGSQDLQVHEPPFSYLDSYFGGTDFLGQEVVYHRQTPIWAMNYYGYILQPELITAEMAGQVIKASLSALYQEGRFLGGFEYRLDDYVYVDSNSGTTAHFTGQEWITSGESRIYELVYHGGLIL